MTLESRLQNPYVVSIPQVLLARILYTDLVEKHTLQPSPQTQYVNSYNLTNFKTTNNRRFLLDLICIGD